MSRSSKVDLTIQHLFFEQERRFADTIRRLRRNDPELIHVNFKGMALNDYSVHQLRAAIKNNTALRSIDLSFNYISSAGARALASCNCKNLTTLDISNNEIQTMGAVELIRTRQFKSLNISQNKIVTDAHTAELAHLLEQDVTLETLVLSNNTIDETLLRALAHNTHLKALDISDAHLGDEGAQILAQNKTLKSLTLNRNGITTKGARAFFSNPALTHLGLSNNRIDNGILDVIETNTTLISLHIKDNAINKRAMRIIKDKMLNNTWAFSEDIQRLYTFSSVISNPRKKVEPDIFRMICDFYLPEIPKKKMIKEKVLGDAIGRYKRFLDAKVTASDETSVSPSDASSKKSR